MAGYEGVQNEFLQAMCGSAQVSMDVWYHVKMDSDITLLHIVEWVNWKHSDEISFQITAYSELEGSHKDPRSPALKWMAHGGIGPITLVWLAPCSGQLS